MNAKNKTRGYEKLAGAAQAFHFSFKGKTVLDIGSSTGGFTQFALDSGAEKVIAIEKGTRQMAAPLRYDERIELHEKTDIMNVAAGDAHREASCIIRRPDVILADLSFTSLRPVLKHIRDNIAGRDTELLIMMKPQFEAAPSQLNRGVVKNERMRREIIKDFEKWLKFNGFLIIDKRDNSLAGRNGNLERFYLLKIAKNH